MQGNVVSLEARVGVTFRLPDSPAAVVEFVVDTGFEGALTLPANTIAALALPFVQETVASLADDNSVKVDVYAGTIVVNRREIRVAVLAMGQRPLLGTALLSGRVFNAHFVENGSVSITSV